MRRINNDFNEDVFQFKTNSGLEVMVIHRPGFKQSSAVYGTPFGAVNLQQKLNGELVEHKKGLAHFLEHKLFEDETQDVLSTFAHMGASANAFTSFDQTMYYFNHNGDIQKPLELLLDFVSRFSISEASVEKEKGIIVEELIMYEQMPDMILMMETYRNVFHHYPLIHDIAGTQDSVNSTQLYDLEAAYAMNYNDERMVMVIVSPKDPKEIEAIVNKQCLSHTRSLDFVEDYFPMEPHEVVCSHREIKGNVKTPKMSYAFKFPYTNGNKVMDEFIIRLILEMNFSELHPDYQMYLDEEVFTQAFYFDIDIRDDIAVVYFFNESSKFDAFIEAVDRIMADLVIDEAFFNQLKKRRYGEMIYSLSNISRIGITVAQFHFEGHNYYDFMKAVRNLNYEDLFNIAHMFETYSKTSLLMSAI